MGAEINSEIGDKQQLVENMMKALPEKAARNRRKHIVVRDCSTEQHIEADDKVIPGILTNRGCAFAGTKGVVFGPIKDMVHIVHGPIGCAFFTWGTRRKLCKGRRGRRQLHELLRMHGYEGDRYCLWRRKKAKESH